MPLPESRIQWRVRGGAGEAPVGNQGAARAETGAFRPGPLQRTLDPEKLLVATHFCRPERFPPARGPSRAPWSLSMLLQGSLWRAWWCLYIQMKEDLNTDVVESVSTDANAVAWEERHARSEDTRMKASLPRLLPRRIVPSHPPGAVDSARAEPEAAIRCGRLRGGARVRSRPRTDSAPGRPSPPGQDARAIVAPPPSRPHCPPRTEDRTRRDV